MTKLMLHILWGLIFCCFTVNGKAQAYSMQVFTVDTLNNQHLKVLNLKQNFATRQECTNYIMALPGLMRSKGLLAGSVDSVFYDSTIAKIFVYVGQPYYWETIQVKGIGQDTLLQLGWRLGMYRRNHTNSEVLDQWQERIVDYLGNNGYPFAKVAVDSFHIEEKEGRQSVSALLWVDKGPLYLFDTIRIGGNATISNSFLQRFLTIRQGQPFNRKAVADISAKIKQLPFIEEESSPQIIWLRNRGIIDLFLKNRKINQVNVLVGLLPNSDVVARRRMQLTGEANLLLKNVFGVGETMGLNWQQLQQKSPRLNILYQQPYLFNSPFGVDFSFEMFRKDSTFLNLNIKGGVQYAISNQQSATIFLQRNQSIVSHIDTMRVMQSLRLPAEMDLAGTNIGLSYLINTTNYRRNPVCGSEWNILASTGIKKIKKNNQILQLKNPSNPEFDYSQLYDTVQTSSYQLRLQLNVARYFPMSNRRSTIKAAMQAGTFQSGQIYRNELFQIGGFKTLRGFDEESQYLSSFTIGTLEYRYLAGQDSYFYVFSDGGWGQQNTRDGRYDFTYLSGGVGLAFDLNAGIINLAWAVGKRSDAPFNLRQSKIHLGFVSYF